MMPPFTAGARKREALLSGRDEIAQPLQRAAEIAAWAWESVAQS